MPKRHALNTNETKPMSPPVAITARRVSCKNKTNNNAYRINPRDVLYAFTSAALENGLVAIPNYVPERFCSGHVYFRIPGGVFEFQSDVRSFKNLPLDSKNFIRIHKSILVNLTKWSVVDLRSKDKRFEFWFNDKTIESLPISRRQVYTVRKALRLPVRKPRDICEV